MKFPFVVIPEVTPAVRERYRRHIDSDASGWHRRWTESIWRRHQHPSNAEKSGWRSPDDQRRRLVHFYDEYGLEGDAFVLRHSYLFLGLTLPTEHIAEYRAAIAEGMDRGEWRSAGTADGFTLHARGDLRARIREVTVHPEDEKRGRSVPRGYRSLDVVVTSAGCEPPPGWTERPWKVFFEVGLRQTLAPGRPTPIAPEEIARHLPAQLELGCGPSIEAGIPHLSTLHRIYGVSRADYGFVFRAADDGLLDLFAHPEAKFREMTDIYGRCAAAGTTPFYQRTLELFRHGHFVGPVITNNFDCQCAELGLPEISLRQYDWQPYYPVIVPDPRARSLLVVGVHADRRLVQMWARARGLRVIFVDPESYIAPDGRPIHYPVEAPQDQDLFARCTADEALARLRATLLGGGGSIRGQ
jgi:hypothetical protein